MLSRETYAQLLLESCIILINNPEKQNQDKAALTHVQRARHMSLDRSSPAVSLHVPIYDRDFWGPFPVILCQPRMVAAFTVWASSVIDFLEQKQQEKSSKSTLSFQSWENH